MTENTVKMYRRRFIPDEKVLLKDDHIIEMTKDHIITKWNVLKKRKDFSHGASCYFLNDNIKVSKFIDDDENILYWYCDIIDWEYDEKENTWVFNDLLIDVIVYENGFVKVVDMGEVSEALEKGLIDDNLVKKALTTVDNLLQKIYNNEFDYYKNFILNIWGYNYAY